MNKSPSDLYLDLMKKVLSFTLWPDPPIPVEIFNYRRARPKQWLVSTVVRLLRLRDLRLAKEQHYTDEQRINGQIHPTYGDTMIGLKRLDDLQYCVETALREGIEGDLIETGVWRGGACIFMRAILAAHGVTNRRVFVADSFEGLPKPDAEKYPADKGDIHHAHSAILGVSQEQVEANFRRYGLLDDQVVFLKGWFKDTMPTAPITKLAVLRLDGDMYGSTMEVLEHMYPKLSPGGFCVIDDYALAGCRKAVDDYRAAHGITAPMREVDWSGLHWRK